MCSTIEEKWRRGTKVKIHTATYLLRQCLVHCHRRYVTFYPSQHTRFILFFPVGETAKTTSTLFPQRLQICALFFAPALAETSVFDFTLSAIWIPPFSFSALYVKLSRTPSYVYRTRRYPVHILLRDGYFWCRLHIHQETWKLHILIRLKNNCQ